MKLNNKQIRHLKSLGHGLHPVVRVGQKGVTKSVITELAGAINHHELVKIKIGISDRDERRQAIADLSTKTNTQIIAQIGQIALLFKRNREKPVVVFPR